MIELYSVKETARLFGLKPSQLRYWTQTGFVSPTVRRGGRLFYTFRDLVGVRAAKELLASGMTMDQARPSIEILRARLPERIGPSDPLAICSDGSQFEVQREDEVTPPATRDVVVAFRISSIASQIADVLGREAQDEPEPLIKTADLEGSAPNAIPAPMNDQATEPHAPPSAYECFRAGYQAEKSGQLEVAETWYLRATELEPTLAAAHTNLGNIYYQSGQLDEARQAYLAALDYDPDQPEARFNLGNLFDEVGETEKAIAELRQVVSRHPHFADAHYNLGLVLHRVGGHAQAKAHLSRYLELDSESEWALRARQLADDTTMLQA
jgi:tetratricopeptide (TPR) repeat protein